MRNAHQPFHCRFQPLDETPGHIAARERVAFIDRVCGLLIESRFGNYGDFDTVGKLKNSFGSLLPDREMPDDLYDLTGQLRMHAHMAVPFTGRKRDIVTSLLPYVAVKVLAPIEAFRSATTLARGSPGTGRVAVLRI